MKKFAKFFVMGLGLVVISTMLVACGEVNVLSHVGVNEQRAPSVNFYAPKSVKYNGNEMTISVNHAATQVALDIYNLAYALGIEMADLEVSAEIEGVATPPGFGIFTRVNTGSNEFWRPYGTDTGSYTVDQGGRINGLVPIYHYADSTNWRGPHTAYFVLGAPAQGAKRSLELTLTDGNDVKYTFTLVIQRDSE